MPDDDRKTTDLDPRLERMRKEFDRYTDAWDEPRQQAAQDMKCLSLDGPWPDKERKAREAPGNERPCLHEDIISQYINQVVNQMEMNPLAPDVQPEGEGANEESAVFIKNRIRQIQYEQNAPHAHLTGGKTAVESSMGYWKLETSYTQADSFIKTICIKSIQDPTNILVDPDCKEPDWHDMNGAFELSRLSHEEFRQKYPGARIKSFDGLINNDTKAWLDDQTVQIAAWWHRDKKPRKLLLLDDGTPEGWSIFEDELPKNLKRRGTKQGYVEIVGDDFAEAGFPKGKRYPILTERKSEKCIVKKTVATAVEILDETTFEDEEIPILVVTGRIKFEHGKRVIESLTRKARVGQLLYDYLISAIQEVIGMTPKFKVMGPEGTFDTSTDWARVHRSPTAYAEYKPVQDPENGQTMPPPQFVEYEPPIQALELAKQSILLSVQNAIGMTSTERKDRAAKSGKAIEALQETMNVATYHFFNSLKMAQLREGRIINRLLPKIENTPRQVGLRDDKGNFSTKQIGQGHYDQLGKHQVVIGLQKYYQNQQQEQSDFADTLLSMKDPTLLLAVLPGAIRMKGLGAYGDELAKMVEAMQPPPMQQARQAQQGGQQQIPPEVQQAIQAMQQQAKQTIDALMMQVQELTQEKEAKVLDLQNKKEIAELQADTQLKVAGINASVKEDIASLDQQIASVSHLVDILRQQSEQSHEAGQNALNRGHEAIQSDQQRQHEAAQSDQDRALAAQQADQQAQLQQQQMEQQPQP